MDIYERSPTNGAALRQGEILSNLSQFSIQIETIGTDKPVVNIQLHPYAIIVSQDCDLDWDYRARSGAKASESKLIPNMLLCEVETAQALSESPGVDARIWRAIQRNNDQRYQFFQAVAKDHDRENEGLPELAADFKRYFTVPTDALYFQVSNWATKRRCILRSPYLEHMCRRFFNYQSRIALPSEHYSDPAT